MTKSELFKKRIERKLLTIEHEQSFTSSWFGIFFNPFFITRRALAREISTFASSLKSDVTILDVGCGSKPYCKLFNTKYYIGIDIEGGGLDDNSKGQDVFFDGEHIPFPNEKFDVVMATEVLEHALSPEKLVADMYRVLKKDGLIFITVPFVWTEHGKPYDFRRLTSFGHRKILTEQGFSHIETHKTSGIFATCGQIISDFIIDTFHNWINTLFNSQGIKYKLKFILDRLIILLVCMPVQAIFLAIDYVFGHRGIGLDFISIAKK